MPTRDSLYGTPDKLLARLRLHTEFATHPLGWFPWWHETVQPARFARVLDVGCGDGSLWAAAESLPERLTLVDTSPGMLTRAGERVAGRGSEVVRVNASAHALPFDDASFDAVIANHMLYHTTPPRALAELRRVLSRGGRLFAATNGPDAMAEMHDLITVLRPSYRRPHFHEVFGLHNGPAMVAQHFEDVRVERYPNHLEVTDSRALIDYILSMEATKDLTAEEQAQLRSGADAQITEHGHLRIQGDTGVITARAAQNPWAPRILEEQPDVEARLVDVQLHLRLDRDVDVVAEAVGDVAQLRE
ncbi:MAG: class I SAM-dependent methyltransferase [Myxococcales bacterium]|nr:class I SAM-dependent methyltransferase [Myxococcales bacterium]